MSEMIKMEDLEEKFSLWEKIDEDNYPEKLKKDNKPDDIYKHPGIYAIAIDESDSMDGKKFHFEDISRKIVYFGMTNSKDGLRGRLKQFFNTIYKCNGTSQHGGACRFCTHAEKKIDKKWKEKLFFSTYPFKKCIVDELGSGNIKGKIIGEEKAPEMFEFMGKVALTEYLCFTHYVRKNREMPKFNNKSDNEKACRMKI